MKSLNALYLAIPFLLLSSMSCDKDPEIPNPEELITTVIYTLTPVGGGSPAIFSFRDPDGDGGNSPVITWDTLTAGVTYSGSIRLLNESVTPVVDITPELEDESEDHQFFYTINALHASVEYDDQDPSGYPIGLSTTFTASGPGQGTVVVTLRHLPDKTASGVSDGILQNAGGETDIEVTFPVVIL